MAKKPLSKVKLKDLKSRTKEEIDWEITLGRIYRDSKIERPPKIMKKRGSK